MKTSTLRNLRGSSSSSDTHLYQVYVILRRKKLSKYPWLADDRNFGQRQVERFQYLCNGNQISMLEMGTSGCWLLSTSKLLLLLLCKGPLLPYLPLVHLLNWLCVGARWELFSSEFPHQYASRLSHYYLTSNHGASRIAVIGRVGEWHGVMESREVRSSLRVGPAFYLVKHTMWTTSYRPSGAATTFVHKGPYKEPINKELLDDKTYLLNDKFEKYHFTLWNKL
jgi:hypothetical protein